MTRYFDTSALVPYYRPEPLSEACEALLRSNAGDVFLSSLVEVEVASVLARLVRMSELDEHEAGEIHRAFTADIDQGYFRWIGLDRVHYRRARDWLLQRSTSLRTLDALHLACAAEVGAAIVTGDARLADAGSQLGVAVVLVKPYAN